MASETYLEVMQLNGICKFYSCGVKHFIKLSDWNTLCPFNTIFPQEGDHCQIIKIHKNDKQCKKMQKTGFKVTKTFIKISCNLDSRNLSFIFKKISEKPNRNLRKW